MLNNYSMNMAMARYQSGTYPGQHLWGVVPPRDGVRWFLPRGLYDLSASKWTWFKKLRTIALRTVGDPLQQWAAWRSSAQVIFAADQWSASTIGFLSRLKLIRTTYVVLVHHKPSSWWNRVCLGGASAALFLSSNVREQLHRSTFKRRQIETVFVPWGPDLSWSGYSQVQELKVYDFVAAGRTNRDYDTLRAAIRNCNLTGVIFDGVTREEYENGVLVSQQHGAADYPEVVSTIARAHVSVVPLEDASILSGLTEIADAAALGLPIVVTESPNLPFDIEGLRAGMLVPPNSAIELGRAIEYCLSTDWLDARSLVETFNCAAYQDSRVSLLRRLECLNAGPNP